MDWGRKWLVYFNAEKTQLVLLDWSSNTGAIDIKIDGLVLEENSSFEDFGTVFPFWSGLGLLHCLYCQNCHQEKLSLDFFYEAFFS